MGRQSFATIILSLLVVSLLAACLPAGPAPAGSSSAEASQPVATAAPAPTAAPPVAPTPAGPTGQSLAGRVLWGSHPVTGVRVNLVKNSCVLNPDPSANAVASATSDPQGGYEFANPPVGDYVLCAVWPDGEVSAGASPGVQIAAGQVIGVDPVTTLQLARSLKLVEPAALAEVSTTPTVRWEAFPGIASYHVYIGMPTAPLAVDQEVSGSSLQVTPPLLPGTRYDLNIIALDAGGAALATVRSSFTTTGNAPTATPDPRGPSVDSVPPDCQPRTVPGSALYLDPAGRYCFLYPARFHVQTTDLGQQDVDLAVVGPALDQNPDPLRAVFQIAVTPQPAGQDLKAAVDDYLKQFAGLPAPAVKRQDFAMGGAPAELLEVVPGQTGARVVLALDNSGRYLYHFSFMPSVRDFPQAAADVEELFQTVADHFAFLLPGDGASLPAANPPAAPPQAPPPAPPASAAAVTRSPAAYDCAHAAGLPASECQALVALYQATDGPAWQDASGWLQTGSPCEWNGVTCQGGHVEQINLMNNHLAGPLPPQIADLSALRVLGLWNNRLTGPIPPEVGRLSHLDYLDLSHNPLACSLPAELGQLSQLRTLILADDGLVGQIPETFAGLAGLDTLKLPGNRLEGPIPAGLARLPKLTGLDLSNNQLSGTIPAGLGAQGQLWLLDLYGNQLTGPVPAGVQAIAGRRLWGNRLDGTITAGSGLLTAVSYAGLSFSFPNALFSAAWPDRVLATTDKSMFGGPTPAFTRLALVPTASVAAAQHIYPQPDPVPAIYVYNVKEYSTLDQQVGERILALLKLLRERPGSVGGEIPVLPVLNVKQQVHAQLRYVDFADGQGLRFITQYANGIAPVNNQELLYVYQGLTADGKSYVAAFFPLAAPGLPATGAMSPAQMQAFVDSGVQHYLSTTAANLDALPANQYDPDLALLDAMCRSLQVP